MKKLNTILALMLSVGITSCSSCSNKAQVIDPPPVPTVVVPCPDAGCGEIVPTQSQRIVGSTWEVTIPPAWEKKEDLSTEFVFFNKEKQGMVLLTKEEFTGTFEEFVLNFVRDLKDSGVHLIGAQQLTMGDNTFALLECNKDNGPNVWIWLVLKNNYGYGLSCGGMEEVDNQDICFKLAKTFTVK